MHSILYNNRNKTQRMISKVVFHRGGAVLWTSDDDGSTNNNDITPNEPSLTPQNQQEDKPTISGINSIATSGDDTGYKSYFAINKLIQTVLLSDKSASDSMIYDSFTLKWTFENNLNLVFVAVYFSFQKLLYVDDFLQTVKNEFIKMFNDTLKGGIINLTQQDYTKFYIQYKRIQKYFKTQYKSKKSPKKWNQTIAGKQHQQFKYKDNNKKNKDKSSNKSANDDDDDDESPAPSPRGIFFCIKIKFAKSRYFCICFSVN